MTHTLTESGRWSAMDDTSEELGRIYQNNVNYVWRALGHLGVRSADIPDVCHDVFLVVRRKLPDFEGRSSLRTWIYGICIRTVSDYRARAFRKREVLHDEPTEVRPESTSGQSPDKDLERRRLRAKLHFHLSGLKEEQRNVFVLYEMEELTMKEVAAIVECPLQTAYSRLHAARAALRSKLLSSGVSP